MFRLARGLPLLAAALTVAICQSSGEPTLADETQVLVLLRAEARCAAADPSRLEVELAWRLPEGETRPLRLEISLLRGNFEPGIHVTHVELAPGTESHLHRGGLAGASMYHWRVSVAGEAAGTWLPSGTASFQTPNCAPLDRIDG